MKKSVFAADLRVSGEVTSKGDLDVFGHVEGAVSVRELVVARDASVEGRVRAVSAGIAGHIDGHLESDRVAIESTGRMDGDVAYRTLSMVVGGILNAHCAPVEGAAATAEVQPSGSGRARTARAEGPVATVSTRLPVGASV